MMDENDVVEAVCRHLRDDGFEIEQRLTTSEHGIDIIAVSVARGATLLIEAKGGTSSLKGSARHGKEFSEPQVITRCGKGVLTVLTLRAKHPESRIIPVLVTPDTPRYRKHLLPVVGLLGDLRAEVWMVKENGAVTKLSSQ